MRAFALEERCVAGAAGGKQVISCGVGEGQISI